MCVVYLIFSIVYCHCVSVCVCHAEDVLLWTSEHVTQWVESIGLGEYAHNLRGSGIHGGVLVLDDNLSHDELILALQIPHSASDVSQPLSLVHWAGPGEVSCGTNPSPSRVCHITSPVTAPVQLSICYMFPATFTLCTI